MNHSEHVERIAEAIISEVCQAYYVDGKGASLLLTFTNTSVLEMFRDLTRQRFQIALQGKSKTDRLLTRIYFRLRTKSIENKLVDIVDRALELAKERIEAATLGELEKRKTCKGGCMDVIQSVAEDLLIDAGL